MSGDDFTSWEEVKTAADSKNQEGMHLLRDGSNERALELLTEAEGLLIFAEDAFGADHLDEISCVRAVTASNLGIYHKRHGSHPDAVAYLRIALRLYESTGTDLRTLVAAHLNLAACYLEGETPAASMKHATAAVELGGHMVAAAEPAGGPEGDVRADDYAMLAIAYHKVAESHEQLRDWGKATLAYAQAYEVVRLSLGPGHHLTKAFEKSTRCPRRTCTPQVPNSWKTGINRRQLPNIPNIRPVESLDTNRYQLNDKTFPAWPPSSTSREERVWYKYAQKEREQQKAQAAARMLGRPPPAREPWS